jgi:hypothetical protein
VKKTAPVKKDARSEKIIDKKVSIPKNKTLVLTVRAKNKVWLQLKSDGEMIFQNILQAGSSEEWKADKEFILWTGKAEYLDLILNGNPLGSPGRGVIKNIMITREGMEIKDE